VGRLETVTRTGSTTTTTDYIPTGSVLAESVNGALSYLATSYQGSVVEALDSSGTVTASQLYAPYGSVRYRSGALPTDYGYTGQRADATTGLDYYGARYYDPLLGQFTSADTVLAGGGLSICGLNRYAYVKDNPETLTDPSGNCPQKPQGWKAKARAAALSIILFLLQLPSNGVTPTQLANPMCEFC
jgi:RHS repeat-associated protein